MALFLFIIVLAIHPEDNVISALIPMWDLCNHHEGTPNTFICSDKDTKQPLSNNMFLCCKAQQMFKKDEQFYMTYGEDRSSKDYLITGGFVPLKQQTDDFLPMPIPAKPKNYPGPWKVILDRANIDPDQYFSFCLFDFSFKPSSFSLNINGTPSPALTGVCVVFEMSEEEADKFPKDKKF